ncbi:hypothetical protein EAE96_010427 [Botrytis aclada]|nr:hypothetical protein EAE96_010427 [Botrytis aclada]
MELLESIFNHLVLPPKLPARQDTDIEAIQQSIMTRLVDACVTLESFTGLFSSVCHSLHLSLDVNIGHLEKKSILQAFCNLQPHDILILHVVEQNAALLVRLHVNDGKDTVIFEAFEASPSSKNVLAAENALQWDFPGRAAEIPMEEFLKESFRESLATFLEQASMESLSRFQAHSFKAEESVIESRDTADPAVITQMLMPLLEAVGSSVDVPRLRKRVRDDVSLQNAEFPWRRLPFWLILRVAVQRQLCLALGNDVGRACYKFLICTVLAKLLEDCAGHLAPEMTMALKAKLCRRLAKLEMDKYRADSATALYEQLFSLVGPMLKRIIQKATDQIESAWATFKVAITRPIPTLPLHANEQDFHLSLPNSEKYILNVLKLSRAQRKRSTTMHIHPSIDGIMEQVTKFADRYMKLARLETEIERDQRLAPELVVDCQARCIELAGSIINLFTETRDAYDFNPEQMSMFILNIFDLWVKLDKCAVKACPLLCDYAPVFKPELLDVLQLPTLSSMRRLQNIQRHLSTRCNDCRFPHKTIFSEPDENCFAVRYMEQSSKLRNVQQEIEKVSDKSRENKESQWNKACQKYDMHSLKISEGTCVCSTNDDGSRNVKGCTKCWHRRCRKRMNIAIHEDFLPKNDAQKAAVVFELQIPSFLAVYRDVTFRMLSDLGYPSKPIASSPPVMLLKDYSQLQPYIRSTPDGISLASGKKSFLQTHYKKLKMKVDLSKIIFPQALEFAYYDTKSGVWLKDLDRPLTFQHLCGIHVPRSLQGSVIQASEHPPPNINGPSSYEIMASQTECPSDVSIHEFMSYQRLLSGKTRRWLTMLVELGASNLNFSVEDTMQIFTQLAIQAGPAQDKTETLRDVHFAFQDNSFCQRLVEQIDNRLRNISTNWRETYCMEMLITLSLRLFSLTTGRHRQSAERLIQNARQSTLRWISRLQDEVKNSPEADTAATAERYGFWAALLCRRTFYVLLESGSKINAEDLCSFIQASVALQRNLVIDLAKLPLNLKNMLARDMKMAYRIRSLIKQSIECNPDSLGAAINATWSDAENSIGRTYSQWQFLSSPNENWVTSTITTAANKYTEFQLVHYNFVEGHLMVDGKPLGRLPLEIRESEDVKELFENQHLRTFPSSLSGMSHFLPTRIRGNEVHFGLRGNSVVIQALTRDGLLEYIPRRIFICNDNFDLPSSLIDNCVHWLNIDKKRIEIRRKPVIWKTRLSDWILDVFHRRAQRKRVFLIDPYSNLCKKIARIFQHFEYSQRLTVFQPAVGKLSVEMPYLELSFFVNKRNLLECRELHAEIDPNQDAGTLYGFQSKIVLREVANIKRRSIITALGPLVYKRNGIHVAVRVSSTNGYGKFVIDDVLGRLSCPPEPRLLYSKAQFHAFTSFVLPDPLTGRTGAEEALHTLRSGNCQPWMPIGEAPAHILRVIQMLSPSREYYPKDKRRLQTVIWDKQLTENIQHESYETLIQEILAKSDRLRAFTAHNNEAVDLDIPAPSHLRKRSGARRRLYERIITDVDELTTKEDMVYKPRDQQTNLPQATNVYQIVELICKHPFKIHMIRELPDVLQDWNFIGGFHENSDQERNAISLSDLILNNNIGEQWGSLVNFCRHSDTQDPYRLIFRLALLSFDTKPDMDKIRILAAFGCLDELKVLQPPSSHSFTEFKLHEFPTHNLIYDCIVAGYPVFIPNREEPKDQQGSSEEMYRVLCETEGRSLADFLLLQWPSSELSVKEFKPLLIDAELALQKFIPEWQRLHRNMDLSNYVTKTQRVLDLYRGANTMSVPRAWNKNHTAFYAPNRGSVIPSLSGDLLLKSSPLPWSHSSPNHHVLLSENISRGIHSANGLKNTSHKLHSQNSVIELGGILDSFVRSPDVLRQNYGNDLKNSLISLKNTRNQLSVQQVAPSVNVISESINKTWATIHHQFEHIINALAAGDDRFQWLQLGSLWPCTTPTSILAQLRSSSNHRFGENMKENLISYGVLLTTLQRFLRIRHAQLNENHNQVLEEWRNNGHENWDPLNFPDWLLFEIDSDLLIRSEQIDVAYAIISPKSGLNSVMQLNMGKGKTSCIVPMSVAILADKKQLSRLIVPKALLLQTAQTIQSRLGGLVGREIRHIPFSRRTSTVPNMLRLYSQHHHELLRWCGVILTTPEHILSYKLSGLQHLADSRLEEAQEMVKFQSWLTNTCRDVLDESDFSLAVKTQLIYPSGPLVSVDGHPYRWKIPQILLSIIKDHLPDLERDFSRSIEVIKRPRGFPMIYFLKTDVEDALRYRIINDVCDGRISFLRLVNPTFPANKHEIRRVLVEENIDHNLIESVSAYFIDKYSAYNNILLLRGLLLHRTLFLCLKKRWNVQYGLNPNRNPIAVPFEAKGVPSEQAEFGHPDVSIIFTCLAFYYSGLNQSQFRQGLQHVLKSDNPAAEYDRWTQHSDTLPEALNHWNVINVDDQGQVEELWNHLRLNTNVLDHYMNTFVFPAHAKQFGIKLQASGWDIPLFPKPRPGKQASCAKTTGFSGTNDNKMMLPLNIKQDDLPSLRQTNAEVLTYFLQSRNRAGYEVAAWLGKRLTEVELLRRIWEVNIRILIDAGAYILEMDNKNLVKEWLAIDTKAKGAVYFGADNRAWVQYRGGKEAIPLLATPFAENLDGFLVYIDEAHTRGVDLKFPHNARGALTLALGQTKDHTVQAAMRLRQLGTTQSVCFFAPPEVHRSILDVCKKTPGDSVGSSNINSSHVVNWLLEQTCRANEQLQNLYLAQGTDFCHRTDAEWKNVKLLTDRNQLETYLKVIQQPECQTLEQLYGAVTHTQPISSADMSVALKGFMEELSKLRQAAKGNGNVVNSSVLEEVEQEREVESQIEEIRQVQRRTHYQPLTFPGLHNVVLRFAQTGKLPEGLWYEHAFEAMAHTSIGQKHNVCSTASRLFVSGEFMNTVMLGEGVRNDNFVRPVEWILWNPSTQTALIIISEEAELLIPIIRAARKPKVHLIAYAAPITKNMLLFDELSYYTLPSMPVGYKVPNWLSIELGIFAGRLYFSFPEYTHLMRYLQLADKTNLEASYTNTGIFTTNPVNFLLDWLTLRRKGQDIIHTPMGYICQGRLLHNDHPFFLNRGTVAKMGTSSSPESRSSGAVIKVDDEYSDLEDEWNYDLEGELDSDIEHR